jgi:hypothetical protein
MVQHGSSRYLFIEGLDKNLLSLRFHPGKITVLYNPKLPV